MVRLQKATLCALYAVLELAQDPARQRSAAEIAERYDLSANHLAKVLQGLTRARLVESVRGVGGGYRFIGNPKRVTLYEVIALFEDIGGEAIGGDGHGGDNGFAETGGDTPVPSIDGPSDSGDITAALDRVMAEIEAIAESTLKSITLATLLNVLAKRPTRREAAAIDDIDSEPLAAGDMSSELAD